MDGEPTSNSEAPGAPDQEGQGASRETGDGRRKPREAGTRPLTPTERATVAAARRELASLRADEVAAAKRAAVDTELTVLRQTIKALPQADLTAMPGSIDPTAGLAASIRSAQRDLEVDRYSLLRDAIDQATRSVLEQRTGTVASLTSSATASLTSSMLEATRQALSRLETPVWSKEAAAAVAELADPTRGARESLSRLGTPVWAKEATAALADITDPTRWAREAVAATATGYRGMLLGLTTSTPWITQLAALAVDPSERYRDLITRSTLAGALADVEDIEGHEEIAEKFAAIVAEVDLADPEAAAAEISAKAPAALSGTSAQGLTERERLAIGGYITLLVLSLLVWASLTHPEVVEHILDAREYVEIAVAAGTITYKALGHREEK